MEKNICNKTLKKACHLRFVWNLWGKNTSKSNPYENCCVVFSWGTPPFWNMQNILDVLCSNVVTFIVQVFGDIWINPYTVIGCTQVSDEDWFFWQILRITRILMYIHKSKSLKFVLPSGKLSHNYGKSPFSSWVNPRNFYGHGFNSKLLT